MRTTKLHRYDGTISAVIDLDIHAEMAKELGVGRYQAKQAFWTFVMRGGNARLGAALEGVDYASTPAAFDEELAFIGERARPILNHYVLENFRITSTEKSNKSQQGC